ncbi:E3 ubiquitin-protein ligase CHFR-like [Mytilus galloprovincialis]|uniref:E3 ubiquitin-protein ligase CHFR-like n=1 Tax=Mytilus galloprovincialis TaxID=29158 RepID=UPI003F7C0D6C
MDAEAWGQLVSLTDIETEPIMLMSESFTIGRAKDCDLPYTDNKLVSSRHCSIQKDESGNVWLCDSSTNGTLLNLKVKISKGNKKELQHGDDFYIVYKKGEEEKNVGFVYQSMAELAKEDSSEAEQTQEYETDANILDATVADVDVNFLDDTEEDTPDDTSKKRTKKDEDKDDSEPAKKMMKTSELSAESKIGSDDTTNVPSSEIKKKSKEEISKEEASKLKSGAGTTPAAVPDVDEIEETLMCSICQEIMYNCISLQPCMHSYCAGCYSDWMQKSNECPTCRMKVKRINKNHIVNNLIEAYLKEHPEKKRPEEDLKALDAKNKITKDMMTPTATEGYDPDNEEEEEDYTDSDAEDDEARTVPPAIAFNPPVFTPAPPMLFGIGTPFFGTRPAATKCRQCPGYVAPPTVPPTGIFQTAINVVGTALGLNQGGNQTTGTATEKKEEEESEATQSLGDGAEASTSDGKTKKMADPELKDEKTMPEAPPYFCPLVQNHVLCQCCLQPMPDRRAQAINPDNNIPPQQCQICYRAYCHAYWGCTKNECTGCIGKFKDLNFGKKCLNNLILENVYESEIFKNYVEANGMSVKQVLRESLVKLDAGQYTCPDQSRFAINSNTALCYTCGLRNFKELAYQYRKDIPRDDLPEDAQKRQDCYWGKNCRTQRTRPHHAKNFSHICDQIRTT